MIAKAKDNDSSKLSQSVLALLEIHKEMGKFLTLLSNSKKFAAEFKKVINGDADEEIMNLLKKWGIFAANEYLMHIKRNKKKELAIWFCHKNAGCLGAELGYIIQILEKQSA